MKTLAELDSMIDRCTFGAIPIRYRHRQETLAALRSMGVKASNARKLLDGIVSERRRARGRKPALQADQVANDLADLGMMPQPHREEPSA